MADPAANRPFAPFHSLTELVVPVNTSFAHSTRQQLALAPRRARPLTVALDPSDIDPQEQSPLYDGTIPCHLRSLIFELAMAEYLDPDCYYPTNTEFTRPGFLGHKKVSINLLLTCKQAYLEARHLPPANKTHAFWHGRGPERRQFSQDEKRYFRRLKPYQLALVKEVHLFTQQVWLESSLVGVCRLRELQGIEKMTITLRRGDWWWNESNQPLAITPQRPGAIVQVMKRDWASEKAGNPVPWDPNCWGSAFTALNSLKTLSMEFETYDYNVKELDEIVRHAVAWQFPMKGGMVLKCDGAVTASSWRGPPMGWFQCPQCGQRDQPGCTSCKDARRLRVAGLGPMLIIRSLTWKLGDARAAGSL